MFHEETSHLEGGSCQYSEDTVQVGQSRQKEPHDKRSNPISKRTRFRMFDSARIVVNPDQHFFFEINNILK